MKKYRINVNGKTYDVTVEEINETLRMAASVVSATGSVAPAPQATPAGAETIVSPIPGKVLSIKVKEGQEVKGGDLILILEAMKMENDIFCGRAGKVLEIKVSEGDYVNTGDALVAIG